MDLTVVYYTANYIHDDFIENTKKQLLKAIGDYPLISVSHKPMPGFGQNICLGDIGRSVFNLYKQVLIGAKEVKTKYVATVEDDTLYCSEHFNEYRPPDDVFAFNMHRWALFSWVKPPIFSYKNRHCMSSVICNKDLLISSLEERFKRYPTPESLPTWFGEPSRYEKNMGITIRKRLDWHSTIPNIVFSHEDGLQFGHLGYRKKQGDEKIDEIPYWGKAEDIIKLYKRKDTI